MLAKFQAANAAGGMTTSVISELQEMAKQLGLMAALSARRRAQEMKAKEALIEQQLKEDDLQKAFEKRHHSSSEDLAKNIQDLAEKMDIKDELEKAGSLHPSVWAKALRPLVELEMPFLEAQQSIQEAVNKLKSAVNGKPLSIPAVIAEVDGLTHLLAGHTEKQSYAAELSEIDAKFGVSAHLNELLMQGLAQSMGFQDAYLIGALNAHQNLATAQALQLRAIEDFIAQLPHNPTATIGVSGLTLTGILKHFDASAVKADPFKISQLSQGTSV